MFKKKYSQWHYPHALDSTCVLALDFDDASNLKDRSFTHNTITLQGGINLIENFDGTDDWIEIADNDAIEGLAQATVMFWILTGDTTAFEKVLQKNGVLDIGINDSGAIFAEIVSIHNFGTLGATPAVDDGAPHHIAITYDGSTAVAYIDGVSVETQGSLTGSLGTGAGSLGLGKHVVNNNEFYTGKIDRVFMFNRALTAREINDEYRNYV